MFSQKNRFIVSSVTKWNDVITTNQNALKSAGGKTNPDSTSQAVVIANPAFNTSATTGAVAASANRVKPSFE